MSAPDSAKEPLPAYAVAGEDEFQLRVGNKLLITTEKTLNKIPQRYNSILKNVIHVIQVLALDLDENTFSQILFYMRHNILPQLVRIDGTIDMASYLALKQQAQLLQIKPLAKQIDSLLGKNKVLKKSHANDFYGMFAKRVKPET